LARAHPTVVARDRPAGARLAARDGAGVIVMDDGLQNPALAKDIAFAVVDAATGVGDGLCLPAGPLRAPLAAQWPKVDAVILVGEGAPGDAIAREAQARAKPVFAARLQPDAATADRLRNRRVLAFAGIGRPDKFFATLRDCGAAVVRETSFPDHHPFTAGEIRALLSEAETNGLDAVTTEKDLMRIAGLTEPGPALQAIQALPVRLLFDDEAALRELIFQCLRVRSAAGRRNDDQARSWRGLTPSRFSTASGEA
jgi:tetraacyldisaccharide 4'-kinase